MDNFQQYRDYEISKGVTIGQLQKKAVGNLSVF